MELGTLRVLKIAEIDFDAENRGRTYYGDISELKDNIRQYGLICPIAVYSPTLEAPYKLIAGGRRLMSVSALGWTEVSCRIYDKKKSDLELLAIELFENLRREALPFYDEVAMKSKLHYTLVKMKGEKLKRTADAPGHSQADTAKLLGVSAATITQDLKLAKAIEDYPQLKWTDIKNKLTAMRTLERLEKAIENRIAVNKIKSQLAAPIAHAKVPTANVSESKIAPQTAPQIKEEIPNEIASVASSEESKLSPEKLHLIESYILGDFFKNKLSAEQFSFIEVDPPYGIDIALLRKAQDNLQLEYEYVEINELVYEEFLVRLLNECNELAAEDAWLVLWIGPQFLELARNIMKAAGFIPNIIPGIWKKGNSPGQSYSPNTNLGNAYEMFLYGRKGKIQLHQQGRGNIFDFPGIFRSRKIHPTERPLELMREIVATFAWPKARVLVPFAGSGNTLVAAQEAKMDAIGFDLSNEFREAFISRVMKGNK